MRSDHFAYQQATRVAGLGLLLQLAIGLTMLIFGQLAPDSSLLIGSAFVLTGILVWIPLIVVFHQHRLERQEALEADELASSRGVDSIFDAGREEAGVAQRRLRLMHKFVLPAASLLVAITLVFLAWTVLRWFNQLDNPDVEEIMPFQVGGELGWQLAITLGFAVISFIFSRFVAGMSQQPAWQNLRGGAGYMVGNALVNLAIAVGIVFQLFDKPAVIEAVAQGIAVFQLAFAAEIILNFILNLYRPRRAGEVPRPAFDSRVLSLLAAPDSIVRSINEAVNYQFGFDVTSSWGYQLLLRNVTRLLVFAFAVLMLLSTIVVVQPSQQALRLRGGKIIGDVRQGELVFKWPWPFETVETWDVGRIRELTLAGLPTDRKQPVVLWTSDDGPRGARLPFLVAASDLPGDARAMADAVAREAGSGSDSEIDDSALGAEFALLNADVVLQYRVRPGQLDRFVTFSDDTRARRSRLDMRERTLRSIALRQVTQFLATQPLEDVLSPRGRSLVIELQDRIQAAYDRHETGVEVVSVAIPSLRPPGDAAPAFEELAIETQNAQVVVEEAKRQVAISMALLVGGEERAREILDELAALDRLERGEAADDQAARDQRAVVERMMLDSRAAIAAGLSRARAERWRIHMEARKTAESVLGQAGAYEAAPDLFRQRALMDVLASTLATVRVAYVLGVDVDNVDLDVNMREPDSGLNIADYLPGEGGEG